MGWGGGCSRQCRSSQGRGTADCSAYSTSTGRQRRLFSSVLGQNWRRKLCRLSQCLIRHGLGRLSMGVLLRRSAYWTWTRQVQVQHEYPPLSYCLFAMGKAGSSSAWVPSSVAVLIRHGLCRFRLSMSVLLCRIAYSPWARQVPVQHEYPPLPYCLFTIF